MYQKTSDAGTGVHSGLSILSDGRGAVSGLSHMTLRF